MPSTELKHTLKAFKLWAQIYFVLQGNNLQHHSKCRINACFFFDEHLLYICAQEYHIFLNTDTSLFVKIDKLSEIWCQKQIHYYAIIAIKYQCSFAIHSLFFSKFKKQSPFWFILDHVTVKMSRGWMHRNTYSFFPCVTIGQALMLKPGSFRKLSARFFIFIFWL